MVKYVTKQDHSQDLKISNKREKYETKIYLKSKYSRIIHEFLRNTTLHSLRHVGDKSIEQGSRFIWLLIFISSLGFCVFLSATVWSQYEKTPTIILVENINYPTRLVKFPVVTICNMNQVLELGLGPVKHLLIKRGYDRENIFEFFESFYANNIRFGSTEPADDEIIKALIDIGFTFESVLEPVNQPCDQLLVNCMWRNKHYDCRKMFETRLSFIGYCCTFKMDFFRNNTLGEKVTYNAGVTSRTGLEVEVNMTARFSLSRKAIVGAQIYIHDDTQELTVYDKPIRLPKNITMDLVLDPFFVVSTNDLQSISMKKRKCFLEGVDKMEHLRNYSYGKCLNHKFHDMIYKACGCIPFYLNNTDADSTWFNKVHCNITEAICLRDTIASARSSISTTGNQNDCLITCDVRYFSTDSDIMENTHVRTFVTSSLVIYYKNRFCLKYTRGVLFSWNQLFAAMGGIFGLCLGASMVNVLELLLFGANLLRTLMLKGRMNYVHGPQPRQSQNKIQPNRSREVTLNSELIIVKSRNMSSY